MEELAKINDLMFNGQWDDAKLAFKKINCSAAEYSAYIGCLNPDEGYNFCMLGFYIKCKG